MSSIRIHLNRQRSYTISLEGNPGVLSCIVNHTNRRPDPGVEQDKEDEYHMLFGGIDSSTGEYVDWTRIEIAVGDRIELEILETSNACPAAYRRSHGGDPVEYSEKDTIRSLAKKFGWEVIEHEAPSQTNQIEQNDLPDDDKPPH